MKLHFHTSKLFSAVSAIGLSSLLVLSAGCNKEKKINLEPRQDCIVMEPTEAVQNQPMTRVMTIANIRVANPDGSNQIMFCENAQVLNVENTAVLNFLRTSLSNKLKVKVTFDPWKGEVISAIAPSQSEINAATKVVYSGKETAIKIDHSMNADEIDNAVKFAAVNITATNLVNVIPDMASAQLMFNYLTTQCCAVPGPYTVDYCISFQYAHDGCYARAHKMCDIINNRYHYDTKKVFSFANAGSDVLCVQAQKWGGCCVNWWYHVVPLVNIKTAAGVKPYVFDPAMFDQPVLLSAWLHAQENPACIWGNPNVSMINIQPTMMYSPADYSGYFFDTDPGYASTNATLIAYAGLVTCP